MTISVVDCCIFSFGEGSVSSGRVYVEIRVVQVDARVNNPGNVRTRIRNTTIDARDSPGRCLAGWSTTCATTTTTSRFSSVAAEAVARGREARANDAAEADSTTPRRFSLSALISPRSTRQEETSDPLGVKTPREFKRAPLEQQLETLDECSRSKAVCSSRDSLPIIDVGASQASERDSAVESSSRSSGASDVPLSTITSITESPASSGRASGREVIRGRGH